MPPDWGRTLVDPDAFDREQNQLAHVWTFLGMAGDVANDGDWFRASLATRSVFVQRFGNELKGFENRCAHRFYPLRTSDKGNGPIVCGFHHWRYDQEGRALGIPISREMFGAIPRDLGARLKPVEIATCGSFVFGRFPRAGHNDTLEQYLGEGFPILAAMSQSPRQPHFGTHPVRANWRLCYHITLEDYHTVAVHPTTFGRGGYPNRASMGYFRFGRHSAFFSNSNPQALAAMSTACRDGTFRSSHYAIFQIFPNLLVSHFRSDAQYWHITVQQYVPASHGSTQHRAWNYPAPFPANWPWHDRWSRPFTDPWRRWGVLYYYLKILREDHAICERLQTVAGQVSQSPMLGALEERIAWFEAAYAAVMAEGASAGDDRAR